MDKLDQHTPDLTYSSEVLTFTEIKISTIKSKTQNKEVDVHILDQKRLRKLVSAHLPAETDCNVF